MADLLRSPRARLVALFLLAFAARGVALVGLGTAADARGLTPWEWGWEAAAIADTWLERGVYGDPFGSPTGPSAWLTPPYPALLAGLFTAFDGVGPRTASALFLLQSVVSAATCVLLVPLGRAIGTPRAGGFAAVAFAFHPLAIWLAVGRVWDTTFVAFALSVLLLAIARAGPRPNAGRAAALGLGAGVVLLLNPAPVSLLPLVAVYFASGTPREAVVRLLAFGVPALAVVAPWMIRNAVVLGSPGLRTNLGVELRVGNHDDADGRVETLLHPADPSNRPRYAELGEVAYADEAMAAALAWIRANPARFARLSLHRARLFWLGEDPRVDSRKSAGVGAADAPEAWVKWFTTLLVGALALGGALFRRPRTREAWLVIGALVLFPAPYYLTHVSERYRFPIEPLLVLAACWWFERRREE